MDTRNTEAFINTCRSAFALYLQQGIEAVKKQFPDCVDFVNENKSLTLGQVTLKLADSLDAL